MELWIRILGIVLGTIFAWIGFLIVYAIEDYVNPTMYFEKVIHIIFSSVLILGLAIVGNLIVILSFR